MAIFIRSDIEKQIEKIRARLEKDLGVKMTKTNTVRMLVSEYNERHD